MPADKSKSTLVRQLELRGVDMSWYRSREQRQREKLKERQPDRTKEAKRCGILNAFLIKVQSGTAKKFTVDGGGNEYRHVGTAKSELADMDFYLCEACRNTFKTWDDFTSKGHLQK